VTLYVVDGATGSPVTGATVTVGGFPASTTGFGGRYDFFVPVSGAGGGLPINVFHPGFGNVVPSPSTVTPVPGVSVALTVSLEPSQSFLMGTLQVSSFHSFYSSSGALGQTSITSPQISQAFLDPLIDPQTGAFSVRVPASSSGGTQFFDLIFTSPFFQQVQISGISSPTSGGTGNLSSPVFLQPLQSTLVGAVIHSSGFPVTGFPNEVVVVETGQVATIVNGNYSIAGVPAGLALTLRATTLVPPNPAQFGTISIIPLPGVFSVATIFTN
jgi:hypothetical protein